MYITGLAYPFCQHRRYVTLHLCTSKIASTDWLLSYKENATRCSRDRPSFHTPRDYHGNPRALIRRILIGYLSVYLQSPPQRVSFRKISSQQTNQKPVFTLIFIRNLGL
jgi:hypothetical protein